MQDVQWPSGPSAAAQQGVQQADLAPPPLPPQQPPEAKDAEAAGVRMESQVVFDACWRRFEERHKLKVGRFAVKLSEAVCSV